MATFNAQEILDKTLYSKKALIAELGSPGSKNTFKIAPNQLIGRVYSYIYPKDKSAVYWMFFTGNDSKKGKAFFVKHEQGAFDLKTLTEQGAQTVQQKTDEQKDKKDYEEKGAFRYYFDKYGLMIAVMLVSAGIVKEAVKSSK